MDNLKKKLSSNDYFTVREALLDPGLAREAKLASKIEELLDSEDHVVRLLAVEAAREMGSMKSLDRFVAMLKGQEEGIILEGVEKLLMEAATSGKYDIAGYVSDEDPRIGDLFIRMAGATRNRACAGALMEMLQKGLDDSEYLSSIPVNDIVTTLGKIGDPSAAPTLSALLGALDDSLLMAQVAEAIGGLGDPSCGVDLIPFMNSDDEMLAVSSIRSIGQLKCAVAIPGLVELLRNDSPVIRNGASDSLVEMGEEGVNVLIDKLTSEDDDLCILACNTLGFIAAKEAVSPLSNLFFHKNSNVRYAAIEAVGKIGGARAIVKLSSALADPSEQVKIAAIESFKLIGDVRIVGNLLQLVDESPRMKFAVLDAAIGMKGFDALQPFVGRQDIMDSIVEVIHQGRVSIPLDAMEKEISGVKDANLRAWLLKAVDRCRDIRDKAGKILVVDDSRAMRSYVYSLIKDKYDAVLASDGMEGLEIFKAAENFDFVLTDMNMPRMDGISMVKAIREFNPFVPIVMLTTESEEKDKEQGFAAGVNDYVTKPFQPEDLFSKIESLIGK